MTTYQKLIHEMRGPMQDHLYFNILRDKFGYEDAEEIKDFKEQKAVYAEMKTWLTANKLRGGL